MPTFKSKSVRTAALATVALGAIGAGVATAGPAATYGKQAVEMVKSHFADPSGENGYRAGLAVARELDPTVDDMIADTKTDAELFQEMGRHLGEDTPTPLDVMNHKSDLQIQQERRAATLHDHESKSPDEIAHESIGEAVEHDHADHDISGPGHEHELPASNEIGVRS